MTAALLRLLSILEVNQQRVGLGQAWSHHLYRHHEAVREALGHLQLEEGVGRAWRLPGTSPFSEGQMTAKAPWSASWAPPGRQPVRNQESSTARPAGVS